MIPQPSWWPSLAAGQTQATETPRPLLCSFRSLTQRAPLRHVFQGSARCFELNVMLRFFYCTSVFLWKNTVTNWMLFLLKEPFICDSKLWTWMNGGQQAEPPGMQPSREVKAAGEELWEMLVRSWGPRAVGGLGLAQVWFMSTSGFVGSYRRAKDDGKRKVASEFKV